MNQREKIARDAAHKIEDLLRAGWRDFPEQNVTNIVLEALGMVDREPVIVTVLEIHEREPEVYTSIGDYEETTRDVKAVVKDVDAVTKVRIWESPIATHDSLIAAIREDFIPLRGKADKKTDLQQQISAMFGPELLEGLRVEQEKAIQQLEQMRANLLKDPQQPGYASKLKFCEDALKDAKAAL